MLLTMHAVERNFFFATLAVLTVRGHVAWGRLALVLAGQAVLTLASSLALGWHRQCLP